MEKQKIIDILCVILIFRMCIAFELNTKFDGYFHSSGFEKNRLLLLLLPWFDGWMDDDDDQQVVEYSESD